MTPSMTPSLEVAAATLTGIEVEEEKVVVVVLRTTKG